MTKRGKRSKRWTIEGKVVIVTGSNQGIGKATAIALAKQGATKVILACRDYDHGVEAAAEIQAMVDPSKTTVVCMFIDLASNEAVRDFAKKILATEKRLHVLVNNAGIIAPTYRQTSVDGNEITFATNHLGHFLLTNLLLPLMKRSTPARIVNVSSHWFMMWLYQQGFNLEDPNFEYNAYSSFTSYSQSKFANILFTYSLHQRIKGTGISTYCLHPGVIGTNIVRDFHPIWATLYPMLMKSPATGAKTSVYCATEPGIEHLSSNYFM